MRHFRRFFLYALLCASASALIGLAHGQTGTRVDAPCSPSPALPASGQTLALNQTSTVTAGNQSVFQSNCSLNAAVLPNGASPVSGSVTAKVWVESSFIVGRVDANPLGVPKYIGRHWEITPVTNATTATGRVTLYCSQSDFTNFNNGNPANKLPTGPTDLPGIGRLRVFKYSGTSSDGSGLYGTYSSTTPTEIFVGQSGIVWNTTSSYWEISFAVTGFSGFFIGASSLMILPVKLSSFTATRQASNSLLNWKVAQEENIANYTIERSADGRQFTTVGTVASLGNTNTARSYSYTDINTLKGANYYRLKIVEKDGKVNYSEVRLLNFGSAISIALYPNPTKDKATITGVEAGNSIRLVDAVGKVLQVQKATSTTETIVLSNLSKGFYSVQIYGNDGSLLNVARLIKE